MKASLKTILKTAALAAVVGGCGEVPEELKDALPTRDDLLVDFPEPGGSSSQGLTGTTGSGLVGEAAEFYTTTYYQARELNGLLVFVLEILETVARYPATESGQGRAVWGPFSEPREPNEYRVVIERVDVAPVHYRWTIEGRHKANSAPGFASLARGAFEPEAGLLRSAADGRPLGRGWLTLDFEAIHTLNPAEDGRGRIDYAYETTDGGASVRAYYQGPASNPVEAGYAYGEDIAGRGYVVFAAPQDIHHETDPSKSLLEDLVIRSRWSSDGQGRADVTAKNGDLGASTVAMSQCWDVRFTSTYERLMADSEVMAESGDAASCVFSTAEVPTGNDVPSTLEDVANPHE